MIQYNDNFNFNKNKEFININVFYNKLNIQLLANNLTIYLKKYLVQKSNDNTNKASKTNIIKKNVFIKFIKKKIQKYQFLF